MEIQRKGILGLAAAVMAILFIISYGLFIREYRVEERSISRFAEQAVAERYSLDTPVVRSVERSGGGRIAAFLFRVVDSAGREYHLAAAFRKSLFTQQYRLEDMFLVEDYLVSEHSGFLLAQDYLRSYRFDVRGNRLQLAAAPSRLSTGALMVSALAVLICAAFLWVSRNGDQAGLLEAMAAESAAESATEYAAISADESTAVAGTDAEDDSRWLP